MWWPSQVIMTLVSGFFLVFGVELLIGSYSLKDPFSFIMTFFSASFIILISATLLITFIIKMTRVYRKLKSPPGNITKDQPDNITKNQPDNKLTQKNNSSQS
jgi:TRAP-type C4-dicarboxylate transport system permease small subunit